MQFDDQSNTQWKRPTSDLYGGVAVNDTTAGSVEGVWGAVRLRLTQRVLTVEDKSCWHCSPLIKSRQRSEHLSTDRHTPESVIHTTWRGHSQTDTPTTHTRAHTLGYLCSMMKYNKISFGLTAFIICYQANFLPYTCIKNTSVHLFVLPTASQ